jgi:hypothetical protein
MKHHKPTWFNWAVEVDEAIGLSPVTHNTLQPEPADPAPAPINPVPNDIAINPNHAAHMSTDPVDPIPSNPIPDNAIVNPVHTVFANLVPTDPVPVDPTPVSPTNPVCTMPADSVSVPRSPVPTKPGPANSVAVNPVHTATTASQNSNTFCCRCHKGEVYIMLQDITSTLILGQYFQ